MPTAVSQVLATCWGHIMHDSSAGGGGTTLAPLHIDVYCRAEPTTYVAQGVHLLMRSLNLKAVHEVLKSMAAHSAPSLDGIPAALFRQLAGVFTPQMISLLEDYLEHGHHLPPEWYAQVLSLLPKKKGALGVSDTPFISRTAERISSGLQLTHQSPRSLSLLCPSLHQSVLRF